MQQQRQLLARHTLRHQRQQAVVVMALDGENHDPVVSMWWSHKGRIWRSDSLEPHYVLLILPFSG